MLMGHRGIKASELIEELQKYIKEFGDLYIYKEVNGNSRPIYCINHYPNENKFEIL